MRVDDVGERAGAELRSRFADEYVPPLPWELVASPVRRTYMSRFVLVLAGLVVVAVATTLAGVALDARTPTRSGRGGSMWRRVSFEKAFGPTTTVRQVVAGVGGFVAAGSIPHRCPGTVPRWACESQRLWRSRDGVHWSPIDFPALGVAHADIALGVNDGEYILIREREQDAGVWQSRDARTWTRTATLELQGRDSGERHSSAWMVSVRGTGFVATRRVFDAQGGLQSWRSRDGRDWVENGVGSAAAPVGLPIAARLRSTYLAFGDWLTASSGRAALWGSRDGIHWSRAGRGPKQLHPRMAANAAGSKVFAVQFRIPDDSSQSVGLWKTADGTSWVKVTSFGEHFPAASPSMLMQVRGWWVISGSIGPRLRTTMWISADLEHWIQAPPLGAMVGQLAAKGSTAIAVPYRGRWIRVWHRPRSVPNLVSVVVRPAQVFPPCCKQTPPTIGSAGFERPGAPSVSVDVLETRRFTVDLEPGTYRMTGICGARTVKVRARDDRVEVTCRVV